MITCGIDSRTYRGISRNGRCPTHQVISDHIRYFYSRRCVIMIITPTSQEGWGQFNVSRQEKHQQLFMPE